MKKTALTPSKVRLFLSLSLVLIIIMSAGIFYLAYQHLDKMAADVSQKVTDSSNSQDTIQKLQKLDQDLKANQDAVRKVALVTADGQNYGYQDQIVSELTTYASRSGMTINDITFAAASTGANVSLPTQNPSIPGQTAVPSAVAGPRSTTVTVTIKSPADYKGMLNFFSYIERNLTKFKIANVTLTKAESGMVSTNALSLEVYLR